MAETLAEAARGVLLTGDPAAKASGAQTLGKRWLAGELALAPGALPMPDRPARPERPELLAPSRMPKRGKAGSARARFALLHALAHIELNAIDLAVDIAGRFGASMPAAFTTDWLQVATEEAEHFTLLSGLLTGMGGSYGDLPAHDGLWESERATAHSLPARLAIVPQILEARGLDVTPPMIARFAEAADHAAADVLRRILIDEIRHVETGNRWFRSLIGESDAETVTAFHGLVRAHFRGVVKPPFNDSARLKAGLTPDWYLPLGIRENDREHELQSTKVLDLPRRN